MLKILCRDLLLTVLCRCVVGWDFSDQGAKNLGRKPGTLGQSFEQKSRNFVASLRYNQKLPSSGQAPAPGLS